VALTPLSFPPPAPLYVYEHPRQGTPATHSARGSCVMSHMRRSHRGHKVGQGRGDRCPTETVTLTDVWRGASGVARAASAHDFPGLKPKTTLKSSWLLTGSIHRPRSCGRRSQVLYSTVLELCVLGGPERVRVVLSSSSTVLYRGACVRGALGPQRIDRQARRRGCNRARDSRDV